MLGRCHGWAAPAFNVINQETVLAVLEGAAEERAPAVLMIYPGLTPVSAWPGLMAYIRAEVQRLGIPTCLHLDHTQDADLARTAVDLGFSSVMIDGSGLPLAENARLTTEVVRYARRRGVSVEAELGTVGRASETLGAEEAARRLTKPEEAHWFVQETRVDALAVAIGTAHGLYRALPNLDLLRLREIGRVVPIPLVLHGGSGTPDAQVREAIGAGIRKVNVWTDLAQAMIASLKQELAAPQAQCDLPQALDRARRAAQRVAQEKMRLLGAAGQADACW